MINNIFSKKYIKKYSKKIKYLGPSNKIVLDYFLLSRLIITFALLVACILIPKYGILIAIVVVPLFYWIYTNLLINDKIQKRIDVLYEEGLVFFDMLQLALIKNNDLKLSLDIVTNKLGNSLALEFKNVLGNNKYNNDIKEVFSIVIDTIPNYDVRNALVDLKESDDYIKSLDYIVKNLREKNLALNKRKYQFKPILVSFVAIIFISIICLILFNINNIIQFFN